MAGRQEVAADALLEIAPGETDWGGSCFRTPEQGGCGRNPASVRFIVWRARFLQECTRVRTLQAHVRLGGSGMKRSAARYALWILVACLLAAPTAGDEENESGLLRHLREKVRPLNPEKLEKHLGDLEAKSLDALREDLEFLKELRARTDKMWDLVQEARRSHKSVMILEPANFFLKVASLQSELDAAREQLRKLENRLYRERYGEDLYGPLQPNYWDKKEWLDTPEHQNYKDQHAEIGAQYKKDFDRLDADYHAKRSDLERGIDEMQAEVQHQVRIVTRSRDRVRRLIDRKLGIHEEDPEAARREIEEEVGRHELYFKGNREHFDLETGEAADVWFYVGGGVPPYRFYAQVHAPPHVHGEPMERHGWVLHRFSFTEPGDYKSHCAVFDGAGSHQVATVTFRVTGAPSDTSEGSGGQPRTPERPDVEDPELPDALAPIPPGTYDAYLWMVGTEPLGGGGGYRDSERTSMPITLTVGADGALGGRCDLDFPPPKDTLPGHVPTTQRTWFTLQGRADWQAGTVELSIPEGTTTTTYLYFDDTEIRTYKFQATLRGRSLAWIEREGHVATYAAFLKDLGMEPDRGRGMGNARAASGRCGPTALQVPRLDEPERDHLRRGRSAPQRGAQRVDRAGLCPTARGPEQAPCR